MPLPTGRQARCSNPARALVYLGDAALASQVVTQHADEAPEMLLALLRGR